MADQAPISVPSEALNELLQAAIHAQGLTASPQLRRSKQPEHGDYQANVAMAVAKEVGADPRKLADDIISAIPDNDLIAHAEAAPPGFINISLSDSYLQKLAASLLDDPRGGSKQVSQPLRTVIDYSAPNVAKEMHVGHLRSTVIGDALAKLLEFQGHQVIRQNHLGDWGTQFGMLLEQLDREHGEHETAPTGITDFARLRDLYQAAKQNYDADPEFAECARQQVVCLQAGDPATTARWQQMIEITLAHAEEIYRRLDVSLTTADVKGESAYNQQLAEVVQQLQAAKVACVNEGAVGIFSEDVPPLLIQKSDGGYLYGTTDLAALRYRTQELEADKIIYVTDSRQRDHFKAVFSAGEEIGWLRPGQAVHVAFGMVLDQQGRPFKTRDGQVVPLEYLLDRVQAAAKENLSERVGAENLSEQPNIESEQIEETSQKISIGAIKYADLSLTRQRDYKFDVEQMLSFHGDTGPYIQYADVRAQAVIRKAAEQGVSTSLQPVNFSFSERGERELLLKIGQFPEVVKLAADGLQPHLICHYLHETANVFTSFYEQCPILQASDLDQTHSRLALTQLTHQTLALGMGLLGISSIERM